MLSLANKTYYYVSGNTAERFINFLPTNVKDFNHVVILKHRSYILKTAVLKEVIKKFESQHELEILCSALSDDYLDGVIIRDKKIAFIIDTIASPELSGSIEIDLELFLKDSEHPDVAELLSAFNHSTEAAYDNFKTGLAIHDDLEKIYINEMDFKKADQAAEVFIQKLLQDVPKENRNPHTYRRLFGTNTADGAVNIVPGLIKPLENRNYLKGRAGTGKSHFMKKVMKACHNHGFDIELYHCSFDPNSVDMILVRDLDFCVFDSTDPHEVMPDRESDVIIDLYEKTVTPGTDERFANQIEQVSHNYKSYMKKGMQNLKEAGKNLEKMEQKYSFTKNDVNRMMTFLEQVIQ